MQVAVEDGNVVITQGSRKEVLRYTAQDKPEKIPYEGMGVDLVMECTGAFLTRAALQPYFDKGLKKVSVPLLLNLYLIGA